MLTPIKAIRAKCLDCTCGQVREVRECTLKTCSLHPYRLGKRPKKESISTGNEVEENA